MISFHNQTYIDSNLELGKEVRNGQNVLRCHKFSSKRTFSGDYGWKSLYHFKEEHPTTLVCKISVREANIA